MRSDVACGRGYRSCSNNGINANAKISVITSNFTSRGADVRMLGRNGEVIWIERQAIV